MDTTTALLIKFKTKVENEPIGSEKEFFINEENKGLPYAEAIKDYIVKDMYRQLEQHDNNSFNISGIEERLKLLILRQAIETGMLSEVCGYFKSCKLSFVYYLEKNVVELKRFTINGV